MDIRLREKEGRGRGRRKKCPLSLLPPFPSYLKFSKSNMAAEINRDSLPPPSLKRLHCRLCHYKNAESWRGAWNKAMSDLWCKVKFSFCLAREYKVIWKENLAIYQNSCTVPLKSKLPPSRETRFSSRDTRFSSRDTRVSSRDTRFSSRETRHSSRERVKKL